MTEFKLANKKPNKSNSSAAPVPQQQPPPTQQQYSSSTSYQLPSYTPMQSFPTQVNFPKTLNEYRTFFFAEFHSNE